MRIFSLLAISLALAVTPAWHTVYVHAKLKAMDVPLSKFDERFGTMVAEAPCSVPYVFVNGQIAQAPQVNSNFTAVTNCLNNIYASDIQPNNNTQATFGGGTGITYTFPGQVVAFATGAGGYACSANSAGCWFISNGTSPAYAFNFQAPANTPCGSSGLAQFDIGFTASPSPSPYPVANLGCQGPMRAQSPLALATSSPAPMPMCYTPAGQPCSDNFHIVSNTGSSGQVVTLNGACSGNSICVTSGTTANINFSQSGGIVWANDYSCSTSNSSGVAGVLTSVVNQTTSLGVIMITNPSASTFSGATVTVWYTCEGV